MKIKEVIVVEGRDDEAAINRAVQADTIQTHGFGYGDKLIKQLEKIYKTRGLIIFTDPDFVGKNIREDLGSRFPDAKHAFLSRKKALKKADIGIENASPQDIRRALKMAKATREDVNPSFTKRDLIILGLSGSPNANELREKLSEKLEIGHGNTNYFLKMLNSFDISREELEEALEEIKNER